MDKSWIKTAARDLVAIGGVPFFILVLVRVSMLNNPHYFSQFLISGIFFLLAFILFKQNIYSGLGLIVLVFTSLYYNNVLFVRFGIFAYVFLIIGLFYLRESWKKIGMGILMGILGIGLSFLVLGSP